jgi:hypothetical protein
VFLCALTVTHFVTRWVFMGGAGVCTIPVVRTTYTPESRQNTCVSPSFEPDARHCYDRVTGNSVSDDGRYECETEALTRDFRKHLAADAARLALTLTSYDEQDARSPRMPPVAQS